MTLSGEESPVIEELPKMKPTLTQKEVNQRIQELGLYEYIDNEGAYLQILGRLEKTAREKTTIKYNGLVQGLNVSLGGSPVPNRKIKLGDKDDRVWQLVNNIHRRHSFALEYIQADT